MILHGYSFADLSQHREVFQQLHRKGSGKLGLNNAKSERSANVGPTTDRLL